MKNSMDFPKRLRALRIKKGLSMRKAAELLGISLSMLQRYESGENSPSIERLSRFASILKVDVNSLIRTRGAA